LLGPLPKRIPYGLGHRLRTCARTLPLSRRAGAVPCGPPTSRPSSARFCSSRHL